MTITVDKRIYSEESIANTLYWMGEKYSCSRKVISENEEAIIIKSMNDDTSESLLEKEFWSNLNDYNLRAIIKAETKDIRTILYIKAFSDCDDLTEKELNDV